MGVIVPLRARAPVLVVDDEPLVARVMELVLRDRWDVTVLTDARAARDRLAERRWSALVTDLDMPAVTGRDLALQAQVLWPGIRVVIVSGAHERLAEVAALADAIVPKPFLPDALIAAVQGARRAARRRSSQA